MEVEVQILDLYNYVVDKNDYHYLLCAKNRSDILTTVEDDCGKAKAVKQARPCKFGVYQSR